MAARAASKRHVDGVVLLDKPTGITSNAALQAVKRLYQARKAGHTGSLDPLASGLLAICMGEATKISAFLLDADKHYRVRVRLGEQTDTGDSEGSVIAQAGVPELASRALEAVLAQFRGPSMQVPPMYSALKYRGRRLYELAREGVEVERAPRAITVHEIALREYDGNDFEFDVACTKGTYVRALAEDIAAKLETYGHVVALRRLRVGPYQIERSVTLDTLEACAARDLNELDAMLLPIASAIAHWPKIKLDADSAKRLRNGRPVSMPHTSPYERWLRIYSEADCFLGVGKVENSGRLAPRRLIRQGR